MYGGTQYSECAIDSIEPSAKSLGLMQDHTSVTIQLYNVTVNTAVYSPNSNSVRYHRLQFVSLR